MAQHYPDFYLKKKQRDQRYRRITQVVVGVFLIVIIGGIIGFLGYKHILQPKRQPPASTEQLADERQQLETQSILSDAEKTAAPAAEDIQGGSSSKDKVNLELEDIEYDPSFPDVHVGVVGSDAPAAIPVDMQVEQSDTDEISSAQPDDTDTDPPSEPQETSPAETEGSSSNQSSSGNSEVVVPPPAETSNGNNGSSEQTEVPTEESSDAEADEPSIGSGEYVYKVYAGSFPSLEDAEAAQRDLQAIGYQSQVIGSGLDYLVKVRTFSDYEQASAIKQKLVESGFGTAFATRSRK